LKYNLHRMWGFSGHSLLHCTCPAAFELFTLRDTGYMGSDPWSQGLSNSGPAPPDSHESN